MYTGSGGVHKLDTLADEGEGGSLNAYACLRGGGGGHWFAYVSKFTKHYFTHILSFRMKYHIMMYIVHYGMCKTYVATVQDRIHFFFQLCLCRWGEGSKIGKILLT